MASITTTANGLRAIQFVAKDGKRRTIRLGRLPMKAAETVKLRVEALAAAQMANLPLDRDTPIWLAACGDDLAAKLSAVGLTAGRHTDTLGAFLDKYLASRKGLKRRTYIKPGDGKA